jgi:xanthine dehydrogenase/oxidase
VLTQVVCSYMHGCLLGISFTATFMNQAGALIHIYRDGTVLVTHGGVEMGQGLHTKMCQVAATVLQIPAEVVFIAETSTDKVPNASPSAASASSDLYGMAVLLAARELSERLQPVRAQLGADATFAQVAEAAYFQRIDLCAHGFYSTPDISMDWDAAASGLPQMPFNYFCYGSALSEVEIDCLTGDMLVRRTDICMDVGTSLNPAIDVGQIEGGFVQG